MNKRVYIIHGWSELPEDGWFPWLKKKLKNLDFQAFTPAMPDLDTPKIDSWVGYLSHLIGKPDKNTFLVGHSIGCQAVLRYLQTLDESAGVGGVILVAGFFDLQNLNDGEKIIAKPWLETPLNFEKIKKITGGKITVFLSDNDPFVPLEKNKKIFEKKLGAKVFIGQKGHISGPDGIFELPEALDAILSFSGIPRRPPVADNR